MAAYESKTYHFNDCDYGVVVTEFPTGEYGAYRDGIDEGQYRGFGRTEMEAIADLNEFIREEES